MSSWRKRIAQAWNSVRLFLGVLSLVRFHLLVLAVGLVLVLRVAQVRDMMLSYGLDFGADRAGWSVWLLVAMEACALVLWYTARVMLRFRFEVDESGVPATCPSDKDTWPRVKKHLPRWLGAGVFLVFLSGLATLWAEYRVEPVLLAFGVLAAFALYIVFVRYRRRLFRVRAYAEERVCNNLTAFSDLSRATRAWYWALLLANLAIMILAIWSPHALAGALGPGAVLLLGAALFVVTGSTLIYWSNWFRVPIVTVALVLVIVFSAFNENHLTRLCPGMNSHDFGEQCTAPVAHTGAKLFGGSVLEALDDWVARTRNDKAVLLPIFIVATEGGGIRAAYWTASLLSHIQDEAGTERPFSDYVFAISGVSGGSLGGATFSALVADGGSGCGESMRERSEAILAQDFLGPTLTTLLFPDLLQRFWFHPAFEDRAMTIEIAWEKAWRRCMDSDVFARPFVDLWGADRSGTPLLFLNSTVVESGERLIYSPVDLQRDGDGAVFLEALDGRDVLGSDLPLSTAVHNSARFPYISPVGLAMRRDKRDGDSREHWVRLADGGYFENSAALTAAELLRVIESAKPMMRARYGVMLAPFVIRIRNAEADASVKCDFATADEQELASEKNCARRRFLHESVSPLSTLLNARPAHARLAAAQLEADSLSSGFVELSLKNNGVVHPLGWMLSSRSRNDMTCQVIGYDHSDCRRESGEQLPDVREQIGAIVTFLRSASGAFVE